MVQLPYRLWFTHIDRVSVERKKKLWLGGSDPDATLERASKAVRCLPASRLLAAGLTGSGLAASTSATELAAKKVPAMVKTRAV